MAKAYRLIPFIAITTTYWQIEDILEIFQVLHNKIIWQVVDSPTGQRYFFTAVWAVDLWMCTGVLSQT